MYTIRLKRLALNPEGLLSLPQVLIYYHHDGDDASLHGWWFGPDTMEFGTEHNWAFNPEDSGELNFRE